MTVCLLPVSYTHLDVYKRQLLYIPGIGIIQIIRQIIQAYIVGIVLADKRRHDHLTGSVDLRLRGAQ